MSSSSPTIKKGFPAAVVASPNPQFRQHIVRTFISQRWSAEEVGGGAEALAKVEAGDWQALVLDRVLPDLDVEELVGLVRQRHPEVNILVLDSNPQSPTLVEELTCWPPMGELFRVLQHFREPRIPVEPPEPPRSLPPSRRRPATVEPLPGMVGHSQALQRVYQLARLVSPRNTTVLLTGETGTGKDLVARVIHQLSPRAQRPFMVVNCAAIPETLLEAELFGHTRGAFTGALQSSPGRIQVAQGGTVLLDEVGELPLSTQAKLLRFLQEGEVQRVGSPDVIRVDVRIIAATNADLTRRAAENLFRKDLFYRLSVFPIHLAPLREHQEDILPLGMHFLNLLCREASVPMKSIAPDAARMLEQYSWPGNVRELNHAIERAFIMAGEGPELEPEHFCLDSYGPFAQRNLTFPP